MTQQVRTSYRRHRRAAWGLAIALAVAVAAVVIPLANAADKTYHGDRRPDADLHVGKRGGGVSAGHNREYRQVASLGSAEIYFPAGSVSTNAGFKPALSQLDRAARSHYAPVSRPATDCVTLSL